jgi:two-component system sensor histidine kinase HupT/HoxJ
VGDVIRLSQDSEDAWIEVIRKMDEVYSDLVRYQVELEEKNAALEDAQHFIGSVLSSMTDVLLVCDVNGRIEQVNAALLKFTGRSEAELLGRPLSTLFSDDSSAFAEQLLSQVKFDRAVVDAEAALIGEDGEASPLAINCSSRYDHNGRLVGLVIIGRPIGELRRAYRDLDRTHRKLSQTQQQLVFAEKMAALGRLVAGVAHELNNPISFVFGNMHALKRYGERITRYLQAVDEHTDTEALRRLREDLKIDRILKDVAPLVDGTLEGAERVSEIVQDLRRFSSGQKEPSEAFNLTRVLRTAAEWVVKSARSKPVVEFDVPARFEIEGRKGAIHQIVVNLVQNAVDVTEGLGDPSISISCREEDGCARIAVSDNGPGIPSEDQDRIFEPFFTTKPIGQGTGLGLYVSYGLAEEQGGRLEAANLPGGGAVFTLTLPLGVRDGK